MTPPASRGHSAPSMRQAECKDCAREVRNGQEPSGEQFFKYPQSWADGQRDRGGSATDRCSYHRAKHQKNIAGMAIAYIDLETVGEVLDRGNPAGPLGGLGPMPEAHGFGANEPVDLGTFGFGMDESHIQRILENLADPAKRVLVVKAGTGTGKSTYMPYRLLDPPEGSFRLADLGPIIVTEPRVQATVGVAEYVGGVLSGAGGVGPGFPVGFQVKGNRQHDSACQLIYVTDGTMINWMREGRLSQIGTVIVDEAHERSTNIDFILGYLKRELPRYPHLRVIVTSATFNAEFYRQYYQEHSTAEVIEVEAQKTIGYGWPLFPELDVMAPGEAKLKDRWEELLPQLQLRDTPDEEKLIADAWPKDAPALKADETRTASEVGWVEDLHETTRKLIPLRFQAPFEPRDWKAKMPEVLGRYVVQLANGLDQTDIYGDILGFLPTSKNIDAACEIIRAGVGDRADVYALLSSLPAEDKRAALAPRCKGDKRKIVVSTNLAETSLTVEGVRFVVDSGLIAQSEWDPGTAQGGIKTKAHSQAGIRQRWGRVGRKSPGWVFPLYTKDQLIKLSEDTDPGSTRDNLEQLVMTAKLGGIDDVVDFPWPAAFLPEPPVELDQTALDARDKFCEELVRANEALGRSGAVDDVGHPTSFGKELSRFAALGSAACAVAIMYADRLGSVPEVATALGLLHETYLVGNNSLLLDRPDWPEEWKLEASQRHQALADVCEDDVELVLQICAAWERADPSQPPWEPSPARARWAARWWVNDDLLRKAAEDRREILAALSPKMKEEVKRFIEPALIRRTRGAISRALVNLEYRRTDGPLFAPVDRNELEGVPDPAVDHPTIPDRIIPLARRTWGQGNPTQLANLMKFEPWALEGLDEDLALTGPEDAMRLLVLSADHARPDLAKDLLGSLIESWPIGARVKVTADGSPLQITKVREVIEPAAAPLITALGLDGDVDDPETDDDDASELDAAPELDTQWPTGQEPLPDTEWDRARELLDSRVVEAHEASCGECGPCLAGEPGACKNPVKATGDTVNVLARWAQRATAGVDVSKPLIRFDGDGDAKSWWEVTGYEFAANGEPVVTLSPDWRADGHDLGPAEHPDLVAGDSVELVVGPELKSRRDRVRVLYRADKRGRFVLREAHVMPNKQDELGQIAISLLRRRHGLLAGLVEGASLVGSVLPRPEPNCATVTLLELLNQHLERAYPGRPPTVEIPTETGSRKARLYPVTVTSGPNKAGFVDAELLAVDSATGLRHLASIGSRKGEDPPELGATVGIKLSAEKIDLALREMDLRPIRVLIDGLSSLSIVAAEPLADELEQPGDADSGVDAEDADDEGTGDDDGADGVESGTAVDSDLEIGGYDTVLRSKGPLRRSVALALAELSEDRTWHSKVWAFWARSRHRGVAFGSPPALTSVEPVDVAGFVGDEVVPASALTLEEAQGRYTGGTFAATVTGVNPAGSLAWLELDDGTGAMVRKYNVGPRGAGNLTDVFDVGDPVTVHVTEVGWHKEAVQLQVSIPDVVLPDTGFATVEEALAAHPKGSMVDGTVTGVSPAGDRAWLKLTNGANAMVLAKHVGPRGTDSLKDFMEVGEEGLATVLDAQLHKGEVQFRLEIRDLEVPDRSDPVAQARELYREGGSTLGVVTRMSDENGRAWLRLPDGTTATVVRSAVGHSPVLLMSAVLNDGDPHTVVVEEVTEHRGEPQVRVSIPDVDVPSVVEQANAAGVRLNEELVGEVKTTNPKMGLFVKLMPGLSEGRVSLTSLPNQSVDGFNKRDEVRVLVTGVSEHNQQRGRLLISLKYLDRA